MLSRCSSVTLGTGSVSIDSTMTYLCKTWLCSTLARIATGAVSFPRLRNTALPGGEHRESDDADQQRKPRPVDELGEIRGKKEQVECEQCGCTGDDQPEWFPLLMSRYVEVQQGGDRDGSGHCHAVGVGQGGRALEREHEREDGDEE